MIHCLTSFTSSFFPYEQGNCHLMTEPLRIYLSLYGKLPLPRGMGFSTYAEFTVASGIHHIPRLQGLGIIFTQPAVPVFQLLYFFFIFHGHSRTSFLLFSLCFCKYYTVHIIPVPHPTSSSTQNQSQRQWFPGWNALPHWLPESVPPRPHRSWLRLQKPAYRVK